MALKNRIVLHHLGKLIALQHRRGEFFAGAGQDQDDGGGPAVEYLVASRAALPRGAVLILFGIGLPPSHVGLAAVFHINRSARATEELPVRLPVPKALDRVADELVFDLGGAQPALVLVSVCQRRLCEN